MGDHFNLSEPLATIYNIMLDRAKFKEKNWFAKGIG